MVNLAIYRPSIFVVEENLFALLFLWQETPAIVSVMRRVFCSSVDFFTFLGIKRGIDRRRLHVFDGTTLLLHDGWGRLRELC
jgi:hypothetical protein